MTQAALNNRANQLNPNNPRYQGGKRSGQKTVTVVKHITIREVPRTVRRRKERAVLPQGVFRSGFCKTFYRKDRFGSPVKFAFEIRREGCDFNVYIMEAPDLANACNYPHDYHILGGVYDPYICWSEDIRSFKDANAIMLRWVGNYMSVYNGNGNNERDRKRILPSGVFRSPSKKSKSHNKGDSKMKKYMEYSETEIAEKTLRTVRLEKSVYEQIMSILGKRKPELGGMLGASKNLAYVDRFVFDEKATVTSVEYVPNLDFLNGVIQVEWEENGIELCGFVHSHPGDFNALSYSDIEYAVRIIEAFDLPYLFMPIVTSDYSFRAEMTGYTVEPDGSVNECDIEVYEEAAGISDDALDFSEKDALSDDDTFARIRGVIDIDRMAECTVIGIGCGGARSFYESMARMGVGNFILIDGDRASKSNIASQNGYLSEVGMEKPELVKRRLLDINDKVNVTCFNIMLDDTLDDEWIEDNIISKIDTGSALLCAFTDSFHANARASRIAVKYCVPLIYGGHHANGDASELLFYIPGLTPYSLRDATLNRYESYKDGFKNDVTSVGSPVFNSNRLNATCEKIAVGILLLEVLPDSPYCAVIQRHLDTNFALIRQKEWDADCVDDLFKPPLDSLAWISPKQLQHIGSEKLESELVLDDTRDIFEGIGK